jgi:hypothetical protein
MNLASSNPCKAPHCLEALVAPPGQICVYSMVFHVAYQGKHPSSSLPCSANDMDWIVVGGIASASTYEKNLEIA